VDDATYRTPTDEEREQLEAAYNDYYAFGDRFSIDEFHVVVIDGYETGDDSYEGRLGVVVDGGANATTYGFDDDGAFLVSDALNEKEGKDLF
jgi:hypothetical protein